jgi:hypothetical protein
MLVREWPHYILARLEKKIIFWAVHLNVYSWCGGCGVKVETCGGEARLDWQEERYRSQSRRGGYV